MQVPPSRLNHEPVSPWDTERFQHERVSEDVIEILLQIDGFECFLNLLLRWYPSLQRIFKSLFFKHRFEY